MIENSSIWVVSDVDGTLMDHSYDLSPAKETIKKLQKLSIPVILCTSKTASEVKVIRKELDLTDPYIVENGAAIYGESLERVNGEIILGIKYESLEEILNLISKEIDYKLTPLNNLTDQEATQLTGLEGNSLNLMRDRHWSMPFLNPPRYLEDKINYQLNDNDLPKIIDNDFNTHDFLTSTKYNCKNISLDPFQVIWLSAL